jgi:beta-lactamase superfamily II metal-dependent hydrolase
MLAFLDVGQGDAIYIENKTGENILIDTGNKDSGVLNQIEKVRMCYKVHINNLILTHPDQDHIGEASKLIRKGYIDKVIHNGFIDMNQPEESQTENDLEKTIKDYKIQTKDMVSDPNIKFDNFNIEFLYPFEKPYQDKRGKSKSVDDNDYSIVMKVLYKNKSFLLTGDAPVKVEKEIIDKYNLKSDVLKLGHHGSKNSSSIDFLREVDAIDSIVSAGKNNKFNHPNEETLNRIHSLNKKGSRIRETSLEGNIVYILD